MDGHTQTQSYREFYSRHLPSLDLTKSEQNVHCIFHDDRRPSLSINLEKGTWYCHAEGLGGGVKAFQEKAAMTSCGLVVFFAHLPISFSNNSRTRASSSGVCAEPPALKLRYHSNTSARESIFAIFHENLAVDMSGRSWYSLR